MQAGRLALDRNLSSPLVSGLPVIQDQTEKYLKSG